LPRLGDSYDIDPDPFTQTRGESPCASELTYFNESEVLGVMVSERRWNF
jgi:hypothetical protein